MYNYQLHRFKKLTAINAFLRSNQAIFSAFARLAAEITTFGGIIEKIEKADQVQIRNNKGIAAGKKEARRKMAELMVRDASKASVWAIDVRNADLVKVFSVTHRALLNGPSTIAVARARNTLKGLSENVGALGAYNVSGADINETGNAIETFEKLDPMTKLARASSKTATDSLPGLFKQAGMSLKIITKLIRSEYAVSQPKVVSGFMVEHRQGKMPVRHTGITAHITDSATSQVIKGAQLKMVALDRTAVTDLNGVTPVIRCRLGKYKIQITADGFKPINRIEQIRRGHILNIEVGMERK